MLPYLSSNLSFISAIQISFAMKLGSIRNCYGLVQRSQTRGPREGRMWPANIGKNEDFKEILSQFAYFSKTLSF